MNTAHLEPYYTLELARIKRDGTARSIADKLLLDPDADLTGDLAQYREYVEKVRTAADQVKSADL